MRRRLLTGGSALPALRAALGWTQAELARRSGLSVRVVCSLETGAESPRGADGDWRPAAEVAAACVGASPGEAWPEHDPEPRPEPSEAPPTPEELCAEAELVAAVRGALRGLPRREAAYIAAAYGLDGGEPATREAAAAAAGVPRGRSFSLEANARRILAPALARWRPR